MVSVLGASALIIGWVALFLCGKHRVGWLISFLVTALWIAYAIEISSAYVLLNTLVYGTLSLRNWILWDKTHVQADAKEDQKDVPTDANNLR